MADAKTTRLGIRVKNWAEFQHYKDRSPAWIKLHRHLLDDYDWHRLPDASKALAPMLWLLASETQVGEINLSVDEIAFRLRSTPEKIEAALKPLISAGFFISEHVASTPLASCERTACSEREEEKEEEREERQSGASAPKPTARARRLPDDWAVSEAGRAYANGLGLNPDTVAEAFTDYWKAQGGSNARKLDWDAAYRTWCRRQHDQQPKANAPRTNGFAKPAQDTLPADEPWDQRVDGWVRTRFWLPQNWGPPPGEAGCRAPQKIIHERTELHRP
jgi:hypothetical protein